MKKLFLTAATILFLFSPFHSALAQGQSDLVIVTNAEITFPSCTDEIVYNYFFTVVDDDPATSGTMGSPVVTELSYLFVGPDLVDEWDVGPFNYATYELEVIVPSPALGTTDSDCFDIAYEGQNVRPCFNVTKADAEICGGENPTVAACVDKSNGMVRIVADDKDCRKSEYRTALLLPPASD